mmetsp:Transcript_895/g.2596  ORF Transcript_895/g.2596 Transcript_895/m.2596 type:complete len:200 (-) Transcript_895:1737-2336(-)
MISLPTSSQQTRERSDSYYFTSNFPCYTMRSSVAWPCRKQTMAVALSLLYRSFTAVCTMRCAAIAGCLTVAAIMDATSWPSSTSQTPSLAKTTYSSSGPSSCSVTSGSAMSGGFASKSPMDRVTASPTSPTRHSPSCCFRAWACPARSILARSSARPATWSTVTSMARPARHSMARESPMFAIVSSRPWSAIQRAVVPG